MNNREFPSNRTAHLTPNQQNYFIEILHHIKNFHSFPTASDLALGMGVTTNAAYEMIRRLTRKGFLNEWSPGKYRVSGAVMIPDFTRNQVIQSAI